MSSNISFPESLINASAVGITFSWIGGLVAYDYKKYSYSMIKPSAKFQMILRQDKSLLGRLFMIGFVGTVISDYIKPQIVKIK